MLPSEELRQSIEETYNIDLKQYAWREDFKEQVFSTKLDKTLETHANTLQDVYQMGFNIGHCGLTSRYICRQFKNYNTKKPLLRNYSLWNTKLLTHKR